MSIYYSGMSVLLLSYANQSQAFLNDQILYKDPSLDDNLLGLYKGQVIAFDCVVLGNDQVIGAPKDPLHCY